MNTKAKAKAKPEDYKTKTEDELQKLLLDARKDQMNQRFQRTNGQLENTAQMRRTRRSIARIKTYLGIIKQKSDHPAAAPKKPKKARSE